MVELYLTSRESLLRGIRYYKEEFMFHPIIRTSSKTLETLEKEYGARVIHRYSPVTSRDEFLIIFEGYEMQVQKDGTWIDGWR